MSTDFDDLRRGVVLAELGGYGDGPYCAKHAAGAASAILGTYVVDPGDSVSYPEPFVFKPGRANYAAYLQEHVAAARTGVARVGVSVISVELADTVGFLEAAEDAGADYVSLCAYSTMEMFTSAGLGVELCRRENRSRLQEWMRAIVKGVQRPLVVKMGLGAPEETLEAVDTMVEAGVPSVHIAIGRGPDGLAFLSQLRGRCRLVIAGGDIRDVADARRLLDAGADAVAIATAAMKDPALCGRIQRRLRES